MSNNYYKLFWTSADGQGDMTGGDYASKEDALAAIATVRKEFIDVAAGNEEDEDEIKAGHFYVIYSGPEIVVEDIRVEDNEDGLFAFFTVRQIDDEGEEIVTYTGEWIDLDDGLLLDSVDSNFYVNHSSDFEDSDQDEIYGLVNDHLRANPIPEETLQEYRDAKKAREEAFREEESRYSA